MSDQTLTSAEFRCLREYLGLTAGWLATHTGYAERTVLRWEFGDQTPAPNAVRQLLEIQTQTREVVSGLVLACADMAEPVIETYRKDAEFRAHWPDLPFPALWHRALAHRAAAVASARIRYWVPPEDNAAH
ncbi:helix-turn-helix domain-containing protein [Nocardia sp. NBC_01327]|uniref:helix-turn-helix domain-containing protein n=1 Tax=Nocardia sp. NBC_01327 TaxID=2903593 RepID=UPI002E1380C7|nr:hypothetical protein OG326_23605 [Nocardia sp. NBC_01327]